MKSAGAYGFSRKEIIWFAVIFLSTISVMIYCCARIVGHYYRFSEEKYRSIRANSDDLWNLQEIALNAVSVQRSSLNLIIYVDDKREMRNIIPAIERNRDSLSHNLMLLEQRNTLQPGLVQQIQRAGVEYLGLNMAFRKMVIDSATRRQAADFNVNYMRPSLRKLSDLTRETGKVLTIDTQRISFKSLNVFTLPELWVLLVVALPYVYFFFRFVHLFIKILFLDAGA